MSTGNTATQHYARATLCKNTKRNDTTDRRGEITWETVVPSSQGREVSQRQQRRRRQRHSMWWFSRALFPSRIHLSHPAHLAVASSVAFPHAAFAMPLTLTFLLPDFIHFIHFVSFRSAAAHTPCLLFQRTARPRGGNELLGNLWVRNRPSNQPSWEPLAWNGWVNLFSLSGRVLWLALQRVGWQNGEKFVIV